uniref:Uncharacterized protein n=1 Tax=Clastoptera arizonana TaxID=38151 RepID=A0A1B6CYR4_9HEMI
MKVVFMLLIFVKLKYVSMLSEKRSIQNIIMDTDKVLVNVFANPGSKLRGIYALQFLKGYEGLLNKVIDMVNNNEDAGLNVVECIKTVSGPMFFKFIKDISLYKIQFVWSDKQVIIFRNLIYEIRKKWKILDKLHDNIENKYISY